MQEYPHDYGLQELPSEKESLARIGEELFKLRVLYEHRLFLADREEILRTLDRRYERRRNV